MEDNEWKPDLKFIEFVKSDFDGVSKDFIERYLIEEIFSGVIEGTPLGRATYKVWLDSLDIQERYRVFQETK